MNLPIISQIGKTLILEQILSKEIYPQCSEDERAWKALWTLQEIGARQPTDMALAGGAFADRLSWVFIAGYQAALRHIFPETGSSGWCAFVASEDRNNPKDRPGVILTEQGGNYRLNGFKSWVAQSRHVDQLIATGKKEEKNESKMLCLLVPRKTPGMTISHREGASFLGDMSQGFAQFEAVNITPDQIIPGCRIKQFGRAEPLFVMLAITGFMLSHIVGTDATLETALAKIAHGLVSLIESTDYSLENMVRLDTAFQQCICQFEDKFDCRSIPNWEKDCRLLTMYSKNIQKRGKAQID